MHNDMYESEKELTLVEVIKLLRNYIKYILTLKKICEKKMIKSRMPNFPEVISENIVRIIINRILKLDVKNSSIGGDLEFKGKRFEVKGFISNGPISFGPKEKWFEIYFLDSKLFEKSIFACYRCRMKNTDFCWKNIKVNSFETYEKQCINKRRPRINFYKLQKQLGNKLECIFNNSIDKIRISGYD